MFAHLLQLALLACSSHLVHCSYYLHREDEDGCVSGSAFVPDGVWPEEYKFLFGEYVFHQVYSLVEDPEAECRECTPPVPRFRNTTFYESIRYPGDGKNQARNFGTR